MLQPAVAEARVPRPALAGLIDEAGGKRELVLGVDDELLKRKVGAEPRPGTRPAPHRRLATWRGGCGSAGRWRLPPAAGRRPGGPALSKHNLPWQL
jgi:hypothetical protein